MDPPVDALHREIEQVVLLPNEVEWDDVRMRELRYGFGFATEAVEDRLRGDHIRGQHLDREMSLERDVTDEEHDREPTLAQGTFDDVAVAEGCSELLGEIGGVGHVDIMQRRAPESPVGGSRRSMTSGGWAG